MHKEKPLIVFTNNLVRIIVLTIIILFLVNIGRSIWKNHQVKLQIVDLEKQIDDLENEKISLQNKIMYFDTNTYKELEARKHLGYIKKGEKIIILLAQEKEEIIDFKEQKEEQKLKQLNDIPNWKKWINYIFG